MKACVVYGTRPEMVKLSVLSQTYDVDTICVDQQPDLSEFYSNLMPDPTHRLSLVKGDLNERFADCISKISRLLKGYDTVLVQGDTMTAAAAALSAFQSGIKVGHIEAGLRTNDISSPFPEEGYRSIISRISTWNFCPTELSAQNLEKENCHGSIFVTGNTVIDLVKEMSKDKPITFDNEIILTLHRRENIIHLPRILSSIRRVADRDDGFKWTMPVHPNPHVKEVVLKELRGSNISLVDSIEYPSFIEKLRTCRLIVTDSGGIQEEAAFFKKRVVVCRESTERPEGISAGFASIGFDDPGHSILEALDSPPWDGSNPYGNGTSSKIIADLLKIPNRGV
jgi:UDP-N-acetylglucosamine 2-epimerase (non-hydrolysing)